MISNILYAIGIYAYMLGVSFAALFNKKARLMVKGHINTFRILKNQVDKDAHYVWFHAASLGEFEQGRPLMERMRREHPEYKILLTFFSPSGYEVRKNYDGADIVCYLPFDTFGNVLSFMRLIHPEMLFLIKYEFWCNFLVACDHRNIPVYSISSIFRANKIYFRWYGKAYATALKRRIAHFFVQDQESADLLHTIGIKDNVTISGDTRFDRVLDICHQAKELPLVEKFVGDCQNVFVAGSSWGPDEDIIIPFFNAHPKMKLILAPHVVSEEHLQQIQQKLKRPFLRYTEANENNVKDADCLIINCYGLLSSIYRYGQVAYVGGGFGVGIHNVPEAAVYGIPVLIGPNNKGFREAQDLLKLGGCFEITNKEVFNTAVERLFRDKKLRCARGETCAEYISSNSGATDAIFETLKL